MGRTKQSCRKASNGMSSAEQMACYSSASVKQYITSQQPTGASIENKNKIFVNCDNTFASFRFNRPVADRVFQPVVQFARLRKHSASCIADPALFMRLDFASCLDGNQRAAVEHRPSLDAIFAVDASGSMGCEFPIDASNRNKLEVAKQCILEICSKMTKRDRIGITAFDTSSRDIFPLQTFEGKSTIAAIRAAFKNLSPGGGTNLTVGLGGGFDALGASSPKDGRMRRVFFLTDMESDLSDETRMIAYAHEQARKSLASYLTVVGIGVDLSIDTVERISGVQGAKYISVMNAQELETAVVQDFDFDILPIAFNIHVSLPAGLTVAAGGAMGSSEIANLPANSSEFTISTEFPVSFAAPQQSLGGIYLFKLNETSEALNNKGAKTIRCTWRDLQGKEHAIDIPIALPEILQEGQDVSEGCDIGLRKAVALARYVQTLTEYSTAPALGEELNFLHQVEPFQFQPQQQFQQQMPLYSSLPGRNSRNKRQFQQRNFANSFSSSLSPRPFATAVAAPVADRAPVVVDGWSMERILSTVELSAAMLPAHWPANLKQKAVYANMFSQLAVFLRQVIVEACNDQSVLPGGNNVNVLQTIEQIRELEKNEVEELLRLQPAAVVVAATVEPPTPAENLMCPLSKRLMRDPVIAADGQTYDRVAIETYLLTNDVSPVTGQRLEHKMLVPNLHLRAAVQNHVALILASESASAGKRTTEEDSLTAVQPNEVGQDALRKNSCTIC